MTLQSPSGDTRPLQTVPTDNPGEFSYRFRADDEGLYSVDAQAKIGDETHDAKRALLRVTAPGGERQQAAPNHALLQEISNSTGGAFFALHDPTRPTLSSLIEFFGGEPRYKVLEERQQRLRETLPMFSILILCLAIEWWWRRRAGLL